MRDMRLQEDHRRDSGYLDGMTKGQELDAVKEKIGEIVDLWTGRLGLKWFTIKVVYDYDSCPDEPATAAIAECHWQYRQGKITFYLPVLLGNDYDGIKRIVVHELCHFLVSPIQDYSTDESRARTELAVSLVTDAILWAKTP